jgi:hypothetical protein
LEDYFQFVMTHAPYFYWLPDSEEHDSDWGRGALVAAFAIDFLHECYNDSRFQGEKTNIYNKIVSLADFILTQQCTDDLKEAYGGFKSTETSTYYYSIDACRVISGLLHAYELTNTSGYLDAAKLAGGTFLKTMQDKQTYGGFARAVDINDAWLLQMDIECLYGLIGLKMLAETYDTANKTTYESMMSTLVGFLREGFERYWLYYDPADDKWHRTGLNEEQIYDDPFSYALLGLYDYEGRSVTVEKVYEFINTIGATVEYLGYNPYICWSGYIDVVTRKAACNYYDGVTSGILFKIRHAFDKPSLALSYQIIEDHSDSFLYWGVKFTAFSPITNQQSTVTVSWLGHLLLNYTSALTPFTRILNQYGENVELLMIVQAGEPTSYYDPIPIKGVVRILRQDEIIVEPGYMLTDFLMIYTFLPVRHHDKIRRHGVDYEVAEVALFRLEREPLYFRSVCRRLLG